MLDIVTYTNEATTPKVVGFIVMNGAVNFGLIFRGNSVDEVTQKANVFWEVEHPKAVAKLTAGAVLETVGDGGEPSPSPVVKTGRGQHLVGKTWVVNQELKDKRLITREELPAYLAKGYVKAGARTKIDA